MNTLQIVSIVSGIIGFFALVPYIVAIWKNPEIKPERVTWCAWFLTDCMLLGSVIVSGATSAIPLCAAYTIGAFIIALLSIKKGKGGATTIDKICIAMIVINVLIIVVMRSADVVLALAMVIMIVGSVVTIKQSIKTPWEVPILPWSMILVAAIGNIIAVETWGVWQVYLVPVGFLFVALMVTPTLLWKKFKGSYDKIPQTT
jgi:hypothetical protein